jgi:hypothetical protein
MNVLYVAALTAIALFSNGRQVIYVGNNKTCLVCVRTTETVFPVMRKANWKISEDEDAHIRMFTDSDYIVDKYDITVLPTYILIEDGTESARYEGFLKPKQLGKFYYEGKIK